MTVTFDAQTAFVFLLIFARLGSMVMAMPGIGDASVPARLRLVLALVLTLVMLPVVQGAYSGVPGTFPALVAALLGEIVVGVFIGLAARMVTGAVHVAGTAIAFQTGLGFAQNVDPAQGTQSALFSSFLAVLATTLIFVLDLHHLLIAALHDSYLLFAPGRALPFDDFSRLAVEIAAGIFQIGIRLAAPFLVFGLIFYMGLGILSRLMPQVQIFFLAMPANILLGFLLLMLLLSTMMLWYLDYFETTLSAFIR